MTYISGDDPPFLIFHGTFDCVVTPQSSVELEKRLNLHLLTHAGHGGPEFETPEVKSLILDFLNDILK